MAFAHKAGLGRHGRGIRRSSRGICGHRGMCGHGGIRRCRATRRRIRRRRATWRRIRRHGAPCGRHGVCDGRWALCAGSLSSCLSLSAIVCAESSWAPGMAATPLRVLSACAFLPPHATDVCSDQADGSAAATATDVHSDQADGSTGGWYNVGPMTRADAEQLLLGRGHGAGDFVVRVSKGEHNRPTPSANVQRASVPRPSTCGIAVHVGAAPGSLSICAPNGRVALAAAAVGVQLTPS